MAVDPDILPIFLGEAEEYLRLLRASPSSADERRRAAHGLKGAASMLGLRALAAQARQLEVRVLEGGSLEEDLARVADALDCLRRTGEEPVAAEAPTRPAEAGSAREAGATPPGRAALEPDEEPGRFEEDWDPATARMLHQLFSEEARDHLAAMTAALLRLSEGGGRAEIEEMLRKAHTLKGSASTVGLQLVSEAAHRLENQLVLLRGGAAPTPARVEQLLLALRLLRGMIESEDAASARGALDRLSQLLEDSVAGPSPELLSEATPEPCSAPAASQAALAGSPVRPAAPADAVLAELDRPGAAAGEDAAGPARPREEQQLRVKVGQLDRLMNSVGELVIDRTRVERRVEELKGLARDLSLSRQAFRSALQDLRGRASEPALVRLHEVEVELADAVANLERATGTLIEDSESLRRTTHGLQEVLSRVRMMPIRWLHARLQRPLRGMARSQGKQVELVMDDESSEMDRSIAEQLTDSLLQLIRNAVAHGIETPTDRLAAGKPPVGIVRVVARHRGDLILLEVEDDGAGIDPARVRQALKTRGHLAPSKVDALSDAQVLAHLFDSGLSTRTTTDRLAGRGVGLDLVRENIAGVGGIVEVSSRPGQGTRFTMRIPMTTAIVQALLFKVSDHVYAIPVVHVMETLFVDAEGLRRGEGQLEVHTRHGWVPLLELHELLGGDLPLALTRGPSATGLRSRQPVILLQYAGRRFGVTCTRLIGPREIVLKRLGRLLAALPIFAGATISGSSKVQFVLDVGILERLSRAGALARRPVAREQDDVAAARASGRRRVLVADDSRSIREAMIQILQTAGYAVEVSADGWEAWERLQQQSYDLLLTDLEMPRLHGYELIARCRRTPALAGLPIVVLTSRTAERNREAALERGADGFLAKPVHRRIVLQTLESLLLSHSAAGD